MIPRRVVLAALLLAACTVPPEMMQNGSSVGPASVELPPPGYGTLRQEEVSIALRSGELQLLVTPLAESVTRVTAPDTYERLSRLANARRPELADPDARLFLVSFFSDQPDVRFVPEEVQLLSKGIRLRPRRILPVTPSWGERRLRQRETEMAVYAFDGAVDLESELTLYYGLDQSAAWSSILPRIQAERARAHARARLDLAQASESSSYLAIFR